MHPSDPVELVQLRHRQRARLMRYGRQSWYEFDDRPVTELRDAFAALMEIVVAENDAMGVEDR